MLFSSFCFPVWAIVEVNMEEKVEVFRDSTAQITCMYTSDEGIGGISIEWLIVSFFNLCE